MSVLTQGTQAYILVQAVAGTGPMTVMEVECITTFDPAGSPADQIEDTCLSQKERRYKKGLRTPGQASIGLNADPANASHVRVHQLSESDDEDNIKWAIGWADGDAPPTLNAAGDDFEFPKSRTWCVFEGYVADFPFTFAANAVVASTVSIQRSGGLAWIRKTQTVPLSKAAK